MAVIPERPPSILGQTWAPWYTPVNQPREANYVAQTATRIVPVAGSMPPSGNQPARLLNVNVRLVFQRERSWVLKSSMSAGLLEHEVFHYLIAYVAAMEVENVLRQLTASSISNLQNAINRTMSAADSRVQEVDHQYDYETNNGRPVAGNPSPQQSFWGEKIAHWVYSGSFAGVQFPSRPGLQYPATTTSIQNRHFTAKDLGF